MIENIVFDWSGTISDETLQTMLIIQEIMRQHGVNPIPSIEDCKKNFALPYLRIYQKYIKSPDKDAIDRLFVELSRETQPEPFPDAEPTLQYLREQGIRMAVLSSRTDDCLKAEIQRYFSGKNFFVAVYGGVFDKKAGMADLLEKTGFERSKTLSVADMADDVRVGRAAGLITATVPTGFHFEKDLRAARPDYLLHRLSDLVDVISSQSAS